MQTQVTTKHTLLSLFPDIVFTTTIPKKENGRINYKEVSDFYFLVLYTLLFLAACVVSNVLSIAD
jgi:hypothetical protein